MDLTELRQHIAAGEDSHFETKSVVRAKGGVPDADDVAKALCSFANSGGGCLALGVEDDGSVTGIGDRGKADALQRHVSQIARSLDPPLTVEQVLFDLEGQRVLAVGVSPFQAGRPFSTNGRYYVRDGNASRAAHRSELDRLFASQGTVTHDEQPVTGSSLTDLDGSEVHELLTLAYPRFREVDTLKYLRSAHCAEGEKLTVAGTLLFTVDPSRHVRGASVSALRFEGEVARTSTLAHETFNGPLRDQIRRTVDFIRLHVPRPSVRVSTTREATEGVPDTIWIEAVTNALTHRDYQAAGATRVFVFDSRVEIMNPGELLNRLTVDAVKLGMPQARNPNLARLLARAQQRDNLGLGVPEIFAAAADAGLPEPTINVSGGEFRLTIFTRPAAE